MKVILVRKIDKEMLRDEFETDDLIAAMEARGFKHAGFEPAHPQVRQVLHGKPKFDGLAGPMWNGDGLRYENWEAHKHLTAD
jgi:hypothetical protein